MKEVERIPVKVKKGKGKKAAGEEDKKEGEVAK